MTVCDKIAYTTKARAKKALRDCKESPSPFRDEIRFYVCPDCNCYHLTSSPERFPRFPETAAS